jgi:hypothetical protein
MHPKFDYLYYYKSTILHYIKLVPSVIYRISSSSILMIFSYFYLLFEADSFKQSPRQNLYVLFLSYLSHMPGQIILQDFTILIS